MSSELIGEVEVPNYEELWKEATRRADHLVRERTKIESELVEARKFNAELLRKILESQKPKKTSWFPKWLNTSIKIPLS